MEPVTDPAPVDHSLDVASSPRHGVRISNDEWFEISHALEPHHAVFYKVWQMGRPVFNTDIDTAAVQFDEEGDFIWFHFNPHFWKRLQFKDKLFVICHEALHVILNHGVRTKDAGRVNGGAVNVAIDVVVNHALANNFGFDRSTIDSWQDYCWVDTVFPNRKPPPPDDESFEFYYNLFEKVYADGGMGDGGGGGPGTVDDHSMLGEGSGDWGKVIDALNEGLSAEEKESLQSTVKKHFQVEDPKAAPKNSKAGSGTGRWVFSSVGKVKKKQKWETVIKKWSRKHLRVKEKDIEQWARLSRRHSLLPQDMFLPSDMEVDDEDKEKTKINVWFFLDTSGSCWGLKDRFFAAALSLPEERFNVRLFCFDTTVEETTLASKSMYGGGGTAFDILEKEIQKELGREPGPKTLKDGTVVSTLANYPEAVFVITDGYGTNVRPQHPERWKWFLTEGGSKSNIDRDCEFYNLGDYE